MSFRRQNRRQPALKQLRPILEMLICTDARCSYSRYLSASESLWAAFSDWAASSDFPRCYMWVSASVCVSLCVEIDGEEGPLISGMRDRYELNTELNVNCTAPTIKTNAGQPLAQQLNWQFNKRPVRLLFIYFFVLFLSVSYLLSNFFVVEKVNG